MAQGFSKTYRKRLLKASAPITGGTLYAAPPIKMEHFRNGSFQFRSVANNTDGGLVKFYTSNVYPVNGDGDVIDGLEDAAFALTLGVPALGGVIVAADLALWIDTLLQVAIPQGPGSMNARLRIDPPIDEAWLLVVVQPSGTNTIALDAWANFKSGA